MIRLRKKYILPSIILFLIEIFIALFVNDNFVRPYVGDFLVVIFLYCFISIFLDVVYWKRALFVLLFAFVVEISQHFELIRHLGLQSCWWANIILGSGFEWYDLLAYTLGIAVVLRVENSRQSSVVNQKTEDGGPKTEDRRPKT